MTAFDPQLAAQIAEDGIPLSADLVQGAAEDPSRCLKVHGFQKRDGWRQVCVSCDHGPDAACHRAEGGDES